MYKKRKGDIVSGGLHKPQSRNRKRYKKNDARERLNNNLTQDIIDMGFNIYFHQTVMNFTSLVAQ